MIIWNRNRYSPIHNHPCDGCWVKIISGAMNEVQYRIQQNKLYEVSNIILDRGVTYIDDSMGLHKVGNPRHDQLAITLHLYSPPFDTCRVWTDAENSNQSSLADSYYFSVFGKPITWENKVWRVLNWEHVDGQCSHRPVLTNFFTLPASTANAYKADTKTCAWCILEIVIRLLKKVSVASCIMDSRRPICRNKAPMRTDTHVMDE